MLVSHGAVSLQGSVSRTDFPADVVVVGYEPCWTE